MITNIILEKYIDQLTNLFQLLQDDYFWNTCNQDVSGEYLWFLAPSQFKNFNWGLIELNKVFTLKLFWQINIIYLIPRPPCFQVNQSINGYPSPLLNYKPLESERYTWTVKFARIINSWLIGSIIYDFEVYLNYYTLNKVISHQYFNEKCEQLKIKLIGNDNVSYSYIISNIDHNKIKSCTRKKNSLKVLYYLENISDLEVWYEEEKELFILPFSQIEEPYWQLIDAQSELDFYHITEDIPGLISFPEYTKENSKINYLKELKKNIKSWLLACFIYDNYQLSAVQLIDLFSETKLLHF